MLRPLFSTAILASWSFAVHARPVADRVNVREGCRQALAGLYIAAFDRRERAVETVRTAATKRKEAETAHADAKKRVAAAKAAAQGFDLDTATRIDQLEAEAKSLEDLVNQYRELERNAARDAPHATTAEQKMKESLSRLFTVERLDDRDGEGYPLRLDYKSSCPKYRAVCALSRDDAAVLLQLVDDTPEACRRYAGLSRVRS